MPYKRNDYAGISRSDLSRQKVLRQRRSRPSTWRRYLPPNYFVRIEENVLSTLLAQETVFGWILTGCTEAPNPTNNIVSYHSEVALDKQLTAFWELEDIPKTKA